MGMKIGFMPMKFRIHDIVRTQFMHFHAHEQAWPEHEQGIELCISHNKHEIWANIPKLYGCC